MRATRMRRTPRTLSTLVSLGLAFGSVVAAAQLSSAITDGTADTANVYSNVGAVVYQDAAGDWRLWGSGALIASGSASTSATFLTAGHVPSFLAAWGIPPSRVFVTFDPKLTPTPDGLVDPTGLTLLAVSGYQAHPAYRNTGSPDVGVITLAEPIRISSNGPSLFPLAPPGFLDQQRKSVVGQSVLAIGYGAQYWASSRDYVWTGWRGYSTAPVTAVQKNFLHTIENPVVTGEGGACYGDSGGPVIYQGMEVALVSFGAARCQTEAMAQRIDLPIVQDWLAQVAG